MARQLVQDIELVEKHGFPLSVPFLRKDRLGKQLIPFYRVAGKCLYDPAEVDAVIRKSRFGGKAA